MSESKREAAHTPTYRWLRDTTQEERSWPEDAAHENGSYFNTCRTGCGRVFIGHKRRVTCKVCDTERAPDLAAEVERLRASERRAYAALDKACGDVTDLRRKVEALRSASVDSRGWLVEWRYHGSVQWLYLWAVAGGGFSFTADASKALRLARREDAEAVLEWARDMDLKRGLHSSTFLVTEHVWESAHAALAASDPQRGSEERT